MSEGSRRSRVTITLGRSGQVVNRTGSELDAGYELPKVGTKRSVKERLGNPFDSSFYGNDQVVSKRQRGEADFSDNDLQISQNDLRFKLMQKNAQRRAQSDGGGTMDLREKLSKSEQRPRSLDTRPRMAEPRDVPLPSSRTARDSSQMISSSSLCSPWALEDIRRRSPERYVDTSRGLSPSRNAGRIIGIPRALSPPRNAGRMIGNSRDLSPPRNAGRVIGNSRDLSPPRNSGRIIGNPRDLSPPRNSGRIIRDPRDLSPPRSSGRIIGNPRDLSPPRNSGRMSPPRNSGRIIGNPRDLSPPRNAGRIIGTPRDLSPPRSTRSFSSSSRALSPARDVGRYMSSSRAFSPPRNPGSFMGSSRGSPLRSSNIEDFHGRTRMLDDVRPSPYTVRGVLNGQAPSSGATFARPMLPPPVPNPHPLPPLSQLGSMMQTNPFSVEDPLTVDDFLNSIGLGRYSLAFKREEVDMTTIKQMKESDLKDLIIPMGPRKKILQAIASLPK